jgi:hypothetical protein
MTGPRPAVGKVGNIGQSMAQSPVTRVLGAHERRSPSVRSSVVRSEAAAEQWLPWVGLGRSSLGSKRAVGLSRAEGTDGLCSTRI